jgi:hypothetical protein
MSKPQQDDQWRAMINAPRDGTEIIALSEYGSVYVVEWRKWLDDDGQTIADWVAIPADMQHEDKLIGWIPCPATDWQQIDDEQPAADPPIKGEPIADATPYSGKMIAWQPMADAPRDGSPIVLCNQHGWLSYRRWGRAANGHEGWFPKDWEAEQEYVYRDDEYCGWLPLLEGTANKIG